MSSRFIASFDKDSSGCPSSPGFAGSLAVVPFSLPANAVVANIKHTSAAGRCGRSPCVTGSARHILAKRRSLHDVVVADSVSGLCRMQRRPLTDRWAAFHGRTFPIDLSWMCGVACSGILGSRRGAGEPQDNEAT